MPTSTPVPYVIGSEVRCGEDEVCGRLSRVVIDPVARELTHLVVEPGRHPEEGRLVPVDLVAGQEGEVIRLTCDAAEFAELEEAQFTEFLPAEGEQFGYGTEHAMWTPLFPLGAGGGALGPAGGGILAGAGRRPEPRTATYERVPSGEVQVRRGQSVHATDGEIGKVQGLVVDRVDHQVTHVLLQQGHLWGRKQVALPISNVADVRQGVQLNLSKDQIRDLPPVDIDQLV